MKSLKKDAKQLAMGKFSYCILSWIKFFELAYPILKFLTTRLNRLQLQTYEFYRVPYFIHLTE